MKITKFFDFYKVMQAAWPGVKQDMGDPGFIRIAVAWNAEAILHPENCEDVMYWPQTPDGKTGQFVVMPNPMRDAKGQGIEDAPALFKTMYETRMKLALEKQAADMARPPAPAPMPEIDPNAPKDTIYNEQGHPLTKDEVAGLSLSDRARLNSLHAARIEQAEKTAKDAKAAEKAAKSEKAEPKEEEKAEATAPDINIPKTVPAKPAKNKA